MFIQVLKVSEPKSGTKDGRDWKMQEAECILLDDAGQAVEVAVLMVPKAKIGTFAPGVYTPAFKLQANKFRDGGRKLEAIIDDFIPVPPKQAPKA